MPLHRQTNAMERHCVTFQLKLEQELHDDKPGSANFACRVLRTKQFIFTLLTFLVIYFASTGPFPAAAFEDDSLGSLTRGGADHSFQYPYSTPSQHRALPRCVGRETSLQCMPVQHSPEILHLDTSPMHGN